LDYGEAEEELAASQKSSEIRIYDHRKKTDIFASVNDYVKTSSLEIAIFAEDKSVLDKLKPHKSLSDKIFNRQNIKNTDVVMFFDYPASPELLQEIIEQASPKFLHFMNHEVKKINEKEILKTFSGMLKFAHNNKSGAFDLEKSASFLAQTKEIIVSLLQLFEDSEMIKILKRTDKEYKIEFISNVEVSKTLHSVGYKEFLALTQEVEDYKISLLEIEPSSIIRFER